MSRKLGRVAPVYRGQYEEDTQYEALDVVEINGNSWVALESVENVVPGTNNKYWAPSSAGHVSPEAITLIVGIVKENVEDLAGFVKDDDYVRTENNFTSYYEELTIQIGRLD